MVTALTRIPDDGPIDLMYLLLHGHGQEPQHMQALATALGREYPQAAILCLQAPHAAEGPTERKSMAGFQYFSRRGLNDANRAERVDAALPGLIATIRSLQQQFEMPWQRTALAGFSQGGIVALEAVQAEPQLVGRVLSFGGRHARLPDHAPVDTTVHLLHGMSDTVVPAAPTIEATKQLVRLGADVTADILPGVGHELHPLLIDKAIEQLRTFLPRRLWRDAISEAPLIPRAASSRELG